MERTKLNRRMQRALVLINVGSNMLYLPVLKELRGINRPKRIKPFLLIQIYLTFSFCFLTYCTVLRKYCDIEQVLC